MAYSTLGETKQRKLYSSYDLALFGCCLVCPLGHNLWLAPLRPQAPCFAGIRSNGGQRERDREKEGERERSGGDDSANLICLRMDGKRASPLSVAMPLGGAMS